MARSEGMQYQLRIILLLVSEMIKLHVKRKQSALEQAPVPEEVDEHEIDTDDVQEKNHAHTP
jgi:hypothetical protein